MEIDVVKSIGKALFKIVSKGGEVGSGLINSNIGLAIKGLKVAVINFESSTYFESNIVIRLFHEIVNIRIY